MKKNYSAMFKALKNYPDLKNADYVIRSNGRIDRQSIKWDYVYNGENRQGVADIAELHQEIFDSIIYK